MVQIAVVGGGQCSEEVARNAETVGRLLAEAGAILICGGKGGVMAAAARGASRAGGRTVGILPGERLDEANPYIQVVVATGLGHARNIIVVLSAQAIIALPGADGTRSEIALARTVGRQVIDLGGWSRMPGVEIAANPATAVAAALRAVHGHEI
ncbi:TIGR00725 family protein [bacterium]|nr:TIGR00725 family protein [candidate division CSSED10-310 bacterium]